LIGLIALIYRYSLKMGDWKQTILCASHDKHFVFVAARIVEDPKGIATASNCLSPAWWL